jgi:hypothetical protein
VCAYAGGHGQPKKILQGRTVQNNVHHAWVITGVTGIDGDALVLTVRDVSGNERMQTVKQMNDDSGLHHSTAT